MAVIYPPLRRLRHHTHQADMRSFVATASRQTMNTFSASNTSFRTDSVPAALAAPRALAPPRPPPSALQQHNDHHNNMQLFLKLIDGTTSTLYVRPTDTIQTVFADVEDKAGLAPSHRGQWRLVLTSGARLDAKSNLTVADHDISRDSTLHMTCNLRGGSTAAAKRSTRGKNKATVAGAMASSSAGAADSSDPEDDSGAASADAAVEDSFPDVQSTWKLATKTLAGDQDDTGERQLFPSAAGADIEAFESVGSVHLRVQQRSGRKWWTTIAGLAPDLDIAKILKFLKKSFCTNGTIKHEATGPVIQLQGSLRREVHDALLKQEICDRGQIKVFGAGS